MPADTIAKEYGDVRMANMVLIGALLGCSAMLPPAVIEQGMCLERIFLTDREGFDENSGEEMVPVTFGKITVTLGAWSCAVYRAW